MKAKVRWTHTVEMFVDGESKEVIQNWISSITSTDAKNLVGNNIVEESFTEEIVCQVRDDSIVDYVIPQNGSTT